MAAEVERDITIEGGRIIAGENVILDAGRDLTIIAARHSGGSAYSSESGGTGFGMKVGVGVGPEGVVVQSALTGYAYASGASSNDQSVTYLNSLILAGDTLSTSSGRDTTVAGAHVEGDRVWMDVGRNLTVAGLQDTYDRDASSWNAGANVSVGTGINVNVNAGYGEGESEMDWVGDQTAIIGRKEVDIYVEDHTHIKGAIIATEPGGDLTLNTGTLSFEEIQDKNKSSDSYAGISVSMAFEGGYKEGEKLLGMKTYDYTGNGGKNAPYMPDSTEFQYASSDMRGVLRPTVTEGTIIVRDDPNTDLSGLNRDIEKAREITKDEQINVDVYVSPGAIEEIYHGFEGITGQTEAYVATVKKLLDVLQNGTADKKAAAAKRLQELAKEINDPELREKINELADLTLEPWKYTLTPEAKEAAIEDLEKAKESTSDQNNTREIRQYIENNFTIAQQLNMLIVLRASGAYENNEIDARLFNVIGTNLIYSADIARSYKNFDSYQRTDLSVAFDDSFKEKRNSEMEKLASVIYSDKKFVNDNMMWSFSSIDEKKNIMEYWFNVSTREFGDNTQYQFRVIEGSDKNIAVLPALKPSGGNLSLSVKEVVMTTGYLESLNDLKFTNALIGTVHEAVHVLDIKTTENALSPGSKANQAEKDLAARVMANLIKPRSKGDKAYYSSYPEVSAYYSERVFAKRIEILARGGK